ncbi:MAG: hypothetical protein IIC91_01640 [Chloroflexi bacterium]|nr:hypothetical protein [Chloroflexota bacterium]
MSSTTLSPPAQKREELADKLAQGVAALRDSEEFKRYLDVAARFHSYSFGNQILIGMQCPDASRVAGYRTWQGMGRQVRKGEKGIRILAPRPWKEHRDGCVRGKCDCPDGGVGFATVSVFDVSQTDGDDLPAITTDLAGDDAGLWAGLASITSEEKLELDTDPDHNHGGAHGYYAPRDSRIWVDMKRPPAHRAATLAHELAHYFTNDDKPCREEGEIIAESVAYIVLGHFGIDAGDYSFGYLASWDTDDAKQFKAQLGQIQKTAATIIDRLEEAN